MLAEGMNLAEVKQLLGHGDIKTTMRYLHPDTSGTADIVNRRNKSKSTHLVSQQENMDSHKNSRNGAAAGDEKAS